MSYIVEELLYFASNFEKIANNKKYRFEAPRLVQLYNMLQAEPNEADKKEIIELIDEEEARLAKLRSQY